MCKIYNIVGSLATIQDHLNRNNIIEFTSVYDLINFQKDYNVNRQEVIFKHTRQIEEEQRLLKREIEKIDEINSAKRSALELDANRRINSLKQQIVELSVAGNGVIVILVECYKSFIIWVKMGLVLTLFHFRLFVSSGNLKKLLSKKENRYKYILSNFQDAVNHSCLSELDELKKKKVVIESLSSSIYGAIGEHKVASALAKLSDSYILINDFCCFFEHAIFYRKEGSYIKSIQIDHLLISPSGIFIIETKHWSEDSIANQDFRSPVDQVQRSGFALFTMLSSETSRSNLDFRKHHWGERKVPIRNLIVFTGKKPREEFQFVKILSLSELLNYVGYFTPSFTYKEALSIADFLLKSSVQKNSKQQLSV